jgi:SLIDE
VCLAWLSCGICLRPHVHIRSCRSPLISSHNRWLYSVQVFWKEYRNIFSEEDASRITRNIEKGEAKIQRVSRITDLLEAKVSMYKNPMREMKILYGNKALKAWTEEEDVFIVCKTHDLSYGCWEELKAEIRRAWQFRFDWFFKSRSPVELQRRCDTLVRLIEKEFESSSSNGKKQLTITGLAKRRPNAASTDSPNKKSKR